MPDYMYMYNLEKITGFHEESVEHFIKFSETGLLIKNIGLDYN